MISKNEWMEISRELEEYHAIFNEIWQMGRPSFTDDVATAAIKFNSSGEFIDFVFNPEYWNNLTAYERLFVISHECLHVILNHGIRTAQGKDSQRINAALDIVVNHLLVDSFGFDRSRIRDEDVLCWADTLFKDDPKLAKIHNECYEHYYQLIPASMVINVFTVDDHSKLGKDVGKIIDKLNGRLTTEEKETIKGIIEKHYEKEKKDKCLAGTGCWGWSFVKVEKVNSKKKWETVIFKWSLKYIRDGLDQSEQWARTARRFELLPSDIILPSEMEDDAKDYDRIPVHLYLDTSGSCIKYKNRFFRAALSLPKERFAVRLFCFDTRVEETTLTSGKIYGGGGTAFDVIEINIQRLMDKEKITYPEGIFLITDGIGNAVNPEFPERWYWFLTNRSSKNYIPSQSKTYKLDDFE